jgi:hypothetical protein
MRKPARQRITHGTYRAPLPPAARPGSQQAAHGSVPVVSFFVSNEALQGRIWAYLNRRSEHGLGLFAAKAPIRAAKASCLTRERSLVRTQPRPSRKPRLRRPFRVGWCVAVSARSPCSAARLPRPTPRRTSGRHHGTATDDHEQRGPPRVHARETRGGTRSTAADLNPSFCGDFSTARARAELPFTWRSTTQIIVRSVVRIHPELCRFRSGTRSLAIVGRCRAAVHSVVRSSRRRYPRRIPGADSAPRA